MLSLVRAWSSIKINKQIRLFTVIFLLGLLLIPYYLKPVYYIPFNNGHFLSKRDWEIERPGYA